MGGHSERGGVARTGLRGVDDQHPAGIRRGRRCRESGYRSWSWNIGIEAVGIERGEFGQQGLSRSFVRGIRHQLAEDGVTVPQPAVGRAGRDEPLGVVAVGIPRVGHCQLVGAGEGQLLDILVLERRARLPALAAGVGGTDGSALDDVIRQTVEARRDPGIEIPFLLPLFGSPAAL